MKTGTIKKGKAVYHTPRYNYISPRGPASSGGEAVHVEIENSGEFNLEEGDRVKFELTDRDTAVISEITEKKRLIVTMGQMMEIINGSSDEYEIIDLNLHDVSTNIVGDHVFEYRVTFHPKGKDYHKYITEFKLQFLIEIHKEDLFKEIYEIFKKDAGNLIALKANKKSIEVYDFPNKNAIDFDFHI
jgi:hypothetical protein